jgi:hypothetical protein
MPKACASRAPYGDWIAVNRKRAATSRATTKRTQREQNTHTPS